MAVNECAECGSEVPDGEAGQTVPGHLLCMVCLESHARGVARCREDLDRCRGEVARLITRESLLLGMAPRAERWEDRERANNDVASLAAEFEGRLPTRPKGG